MQEVSKERQRVLRDAAEALNDLYQFVGRERKEDVAVRVMQSDLDIGREMITVIIGNGVYSVNVECDSVPAIIREVIDATCLKI